MTLIMGVLNVTPDSFSDGGEHVEPSVAVARGLALVAQGADIVDIGGESTRPGSERIDSAVEQARIMPVIEALATAGVTVSVDTLHADTARLAIAAGAAIINDVSGATHDPAMLAAVAGARTADGQPVRFILGHWRGTPDPSHARSTYDDVVAEVRADLSAQIDAALDAGLSNEQIVLDPGLGFDKTADQGWQLFARISEIESLGYPVMIGISRKRMLGELLGTLIDDHNVVDRDLPTAVASAFAAQAGLWAVRVHEVHATRVALQVYTALQEATP